MSEFRTINGFGNNPIAPTLGEAETQLIRLSAPDYEDGISEPRGGEQSSLPGTRTISNAIASQTESVLNSVNASDWLWQWGQFLDHDIDLTEPEEPLEPFNIPVPTGDRFFDPFETGTQEIRLNRSVFAPDTGTDPSNPRQQLNEITAYIDGSNVYGSDTVRAEFLRRNDGTGKLKTDIADNGELILPFNTGGLKNAGGTGAELFIAGDIRANEQIGLTAAHALFVREHNRIAEELAQRLDAGEEELVDKFEESELSEGEFIYQSARKVVGAQIQLITYNEFLPILIGEDALPEYGGYDANVNPAIANEFSTAAFRVGHTMLSPELQLISDNGADGIALRDAFFNPEFVSENGVDSLILGLAFQAAQEVDTLVIDEVRNFLFGPPGAGGFDLASLNIQRGRDHGIPSYTEVRYLLGLGPDPETITDFSQLPFTQELQGKFASVYQDPNNIDLWIGGLAEEHAEGALVGETFQATIADQFRRSRDGDRFFYLNDLEHLQILAPNILDTTLAKVIRANTPEDFIIGDDAFVVPFENQILGTSSGEILKGTDKYDLIEGLGGNDIIRGKNGDDIVFGGEGDDTIKGNDGDDNLYGGTGNDELKGQDGEDILLGGEGDDILKGGKDDDTLFGSTGNDKLKGNTGKDNLFGGEGDDTIYGGKDDDTLTGIGDSLGFGEKDELTGNNGQDNFVLGDADNAFYVGEGDFDFALINDFNASQDTIQLNGNEDDYLLASTTGSLPEGTGLYLDDGIEGFTSGDDLIAVLTEIITDFSSGFSFV